MILRAKPALAALMLTAWAPPLMAQTTAAAVVSDTVPFRPVPDAVADSLLVDLR